MKLSGIEKVSVLLIIIIGVMIFNPFGAAVYSGPPVLEAPTQINLATPAEITTTIGKNEVTLELLATYQVAAGVRDRKNYYFDPAASVSPMDLVLAWGSLNQQAVVEGVNYRQSGRWYYYNVTESAPVTISYVSLNSANTHIIPANKSIERQLKKIRKNHHVVLSGHLVNVHFTENDVWKTSLTRTDTGDGSCEIFFVESVDVIN